MAVAKDNDILALGEAAAAYGAVPLRRPYHTITAIRRRSARGRTASTEDSDDKVSESDAEPLDSAALGSGAIARVCACRKDKNGYSAAVDSRVTWQHRGARGRRVGLQATQQPVRAVLGLY